MHLIWILLCSPAALLGAVATTLRKEFTADERDAIFWTISLDSAYMEVATADNAHLTTAQRDAKAQQVAWDRAVSFLSFFEDDDDDQGKNGGDEKKKKLKHSAGYDSKAWKALLKRSNYGVIPGDYDDKDDEEAAKWDPEAWQNSLYRWDSLWSDCNDRPSAHSDSKPIRNQWHVRLRKGSDMSVNEHAGWAQRIHKEDSVLIQGHAPAEDPRDFRGVFKVYDKKSGIRGYDGEFSCLTKDRIEEHEDVSFFSFTPRLHHIILRLL